MQVAIDAPTRPALRYYGGKWNLAEWIINHFPEHTNYVEPCAGACSVLIQKPRCPLETINDLNDEIVNFFMVLRDYPDVLISKIQLTPWARGEYEKCLTKCDEPIEKARRFFTRLWQSMNGATNTPDATAWRVQTNAVHADGGTRWAKAPMEFVSISDGLHNIANRLRYVQIESKPATHIIKKFDNEYTLIYFDPPYVTNTRAQGERYLLEWTNDNHIESADLLRTAAGYVVVSGYACPLYTDLYERHGWQRVDKEATTNSGGKRIESLWLSPRTVEALAKPQQVGLFV